MAQAMLTTSYENEGYDGTYGRMRWWFEAWGSGDQATWTTREQAGRPPTPQELTRADYIVFGFSKNYGQGKPFFRTRAQGLDLRKNKRTRRR